MGFYLRTGLRAGPFRFTLSPSGLGVSAGVPGFRVGTGPRGNYVRVGGRGVSYRASLGGPGGRTPGSGLGPAPGVVPPPLIAPALMSDATGTTAEQLAPTGPDDLVAQLNAAAARPRIGLMVAIAVAVMGLLTLPFGVAFWLVGAPAVWWLHQRDQARLAVVVFYEVNDQPAAWFDDLLAAVTGLAAAQMRWRIDAQGAVITTHQHKTNAGAGTINNRTAATARTDRPKHLITNVAVPTVVSGKSSLHFLPDRVLVRDGSRFSDVAYQHLRVAAYPTRFIESDRVPADARQVDTTWQFVNVKGGPDRRYKDNRQLPVMEYGRLELTSSAGLRWILDCSLPAAISHVQAVLSRPPVALRS